MARAPIIPDNATLLLFIDSIENPDSVNSVGAFVSRYTHHPEFQVFRDSETLRDAAKIAIQADLKLRKRVLNQSIWGLLSPFRRKDIQKLKQERDDEYDKYEFLRRLIATDNRTVMLSKFRWTTR